ncbi:hypothetical protein BC941DRAFT_414095 [Chlamydoabsidia padenii]|nr:hypothetical protein BC941DRAFT_414095 [Chlamydoabsidia padenii]
MSAKFVSLFIALSCIMLIFSNPAQAQVGPQIISPVNNATVNPGDKLTIKFAYQNMGTGTCSVNISLWEDPSATVKIQDVVTNYNLSPGNSSGAHVDFTMNGTYDWYVPHGMNFSFYLMVTETTKTELGQFDLKSFPIMLHPSASWVVLPNLIFALTLVIGLVAFQI